MRGLQVSLNQTQKIRLQRALETLESISSKANSDASVVVADTIPLNYEDGVLKYIIPHYLYTIDIWFVYLHGGYCIEV